MIKQTAEIFEILSKGDFISSNCISKSNQLLYDVVDENFSELSDYFQAINYKLEHGDEYFYFSREESKADMARKLDNAKKWIDILDFLKSYDSSFSSGYRFKKEEMIVRINLDADLTDKLGRIKNASKKLKLSEMVDTIISELEKGGYIQLENEYSQTYKVIASFGYLEKLVMSINITDDDDEISE